MIKTKIVQIEQEVFDEFICDRCGKHIDNDIDLQETHSINFIGGYNSIFGDGSQIQCDLCQQCLYTLIKTFYKIKDIE